MHNCAVDIRVQVWQIGLLPKARKRMAAVMHVCVFIVMDCVCIWLTEPKISQESDIWSLNCITKTAQAQIDAMGGLKMYLHDTCYSFTLLVEIALQRVYANNLEGVRAIAR